MEYVVGVAVLSLKKARLPGLARIGRKKLVPDIFDAHNKPGDVFFMHALEKPTQIFELDAEMLRHHHCNDLAELIRYKSPTHEKYVRKEVDAATLPFFN